MIRVARDPEARNEWDLFGSDGVSRIGRVQRAARGAVFVWLTGESAPMQRRFATVAEVVSYFRRQPEVIVGQTDEEDLPGVTAEVPVTRRAPATKTEKAARAARPTACGTCFQIPAANGVCGCD
ncbi:hypothetical protein IL38_23715 [Actinopolyspora erythraea]|uniref:Uncharacterized protein n=2 Tax=Actinopolyspora erythraea TaxID=414996 RepID=A0ABR4WYB8_9ACTN|nr:hypothetical protein IL38_23715 [Actinopolyspora erythraea]